MQLVAVETFAYANKSYRTGDVIEDIPEIHAKLLLQRGLVRASNNLETRQVKAEEPQKPQVAGRGRYKRRDMRAER